MYYVCQTHRQSFNQHEAGFSKPILYIHWSTFHQTEKLLESSAGASTVQVSYLEHASLLTLSVLKAVKYL